MKVIQHLYTCSFLTTFIGICSSPLIYIVPPNGYEYEKLFDLTDPVYNRDNCVKHFSDLRKALLKLGYLLKTATYKNNLNSAKFFLGSEIPLKKSYLAKIGNFTHKKGTIIWEPPTVIPESYIKENHKYFDVIFTWDDSLVDHKRYRKIFYSMPDFIMVDPIIPFHEKKLCVMMANFGVQSNYPDELYSERRKLVEFFNEHHPDDFDLYNRGHYCHHYQVYRGGASSPKKETLKKYKFCICYENTKNIIGYVTEKIFDCFLGACVPVYWGASNVEDFIPSECFIDRRKFSTNEELYDYLNAMDETTYNLHIDAIKKFLASDGIWFFTPEYFVHTILKCYIPDYPRELIFKPEIVARHKRLDKLYRKLSKKWSHHA